MAIVEVKVGGIQSRFTLLNADERFVIEKHLIDELEWPCIAFSFTEKWKGEFTRTEKTLVAYQGSGLAEIIAFAERHQDMKKAFFRPI